MPIISSVRPHSICLLLNSCSILCHICPNFHPEYRDLFAMAASLSSLHLLACTIATEKAPEPMQSMQNALLRKTIQAENWRLMLNRTLYLAHMQEVLARSQICRTHSAPNDEEKKAKSRMAMRKWQSWSEEPRNTDV